MTSTEFYTTAVAQVREATEKAVETFKQNAQTFAEKAGLPTEIPTVDLNASVAQYFEYVQQAVDKNRELATKWADQVTTLTGKTREQAEAFGATIKEQADKAREQAEAFGATIKEQTDKVAALTTEQVEKFQAAAKDQAAKFAETLTTK